VLRVHDWQQYIWQLLRIHIIVGIGTIVWFASNRAVAQITIDGTLSPARTLTGPNYTIRQADGQTVRSNLFHSFGRFNLSTGESATFQSDASIRNIFSRVTGGSPSTINGLIATESRNVNLFLINPSGIVFGPNASLNVGSATRGSFVSTTTDALVWANGGQFSATNPGGPSSLLTLVGDPSGFLSSLRSPQPITSSGNTLKVPDGQSLLLLGGNITLDNSQLSAPGGHIELAGVTGAGTVGLGINDNTLSFNIPDGLARADVSLRNDAVISVASNGTTDAGGINIKAKEISVESQNQTALDVSSNNSNNTNGKKRTGNVFLDATGSIFITGSDTNNVIFAYGNTNSSGSGDISLKANGAISLNDAYFVASNFGGDAGNISLQGNKSVSLANNSSLVSTAFGQGNSGNITIKSLGPVSFQNSLISTAVGPPDARRNNTQLGNAGNITISGKSVSVTDGTEISSRTFSGQRSGNIVINATDTVAISGSAPQFPRPDADRANTYAYSALATSSERQAGDIAGDISINTNNLRVSDGATLRAESNGKFRGGNINIHANTVELTGGGQLLTTASSQGDAGNINLDVKDRVLISGFNPNKLTLFNIKANAVTQDDLGQIENGAPKYTPERAKEDGLTEARKILDIGDGPNNSGIFANTSGTSAAKGGDVNITTRQLQVQNGGVVTVSSPQGQAGNLNITAREIRLNQGSLTAETAITRADEGANINLQGLNLLLLQNGSSISAQASGNAKGGNITINANQGFVVAPLGQNNDIIASASFGQGGNITINTQGIYGFTVGPAVQGNVTNDIDATSQFNNPGTVTINTPEVDPSRGLIILPTEVVDASNLIASSCGAFARNGGSQFIFTGRGGLPPSPDQVLSSDTVWSDTRLPNIASSENHASTTTTPHDLPQTKDHIAISPATGWVLNDKGEVTLVTHTGDTPYSLKSQSASCIRQ
jgi:filamentous hemagglutinin family protein